MTAANDFWLIVLVGGWVSLMLAVVIYQLLENRKNKK